MLGHDDVHLERVHAVHGVERGAAGDVLVEGLAEEVDDDVGARLAFKNGSFFSRNPSTPTFSRPIELIMPDAVSQMRGSGLPPRGFGEMPLVAMPPRSASDR